MHSVKAEAKYIFDSMDGAERYGRVVRANYIARKK